MERIRADANQYLTVRSNNRVVRHSLAEIDYLAAAANYVDIHMGKHVFRTRSTIKAIEQRLDPNVFARIHRQTIVNLERVQCCQSLRRGDWLLTLNGGIQLRMSRRYCVHNQKVLFMFNEPREESRVRKKVIKASAAVDGSATC
jgi:DNA-binding LytR/AlgR family response regulator